MPHGNNVACATSPPFMEVFESCAAGAGGAGGPGGAGGTDGARGEAGAGGAAGALVSAPSGVLTWLSDMVKCNRSARCEKKKVEVEKWIRRRGNDQGSPNWLMGCVATRWWIRKL